MKFISILLKEGRREDLQKKYSQKFEGGTGLDFILNISDLVDFNHKYTDWVLKNIDPESETFDDDVEYIVELIKDFDKYQSQFPKKDINQYVSVNELDALVSHVRKKKKEKELENQVDKIYEDDKFLVVRPLTIEASCKYGANTKWCTTVKGADHFKKYTSGSQGLYYIINKANSTNQNYSKIAVHIDYRGNKRFYDSKDELMNDREISIFEYAFPEIINSINNDYNKDSKLKEQRLLNTVFNQEGRSVRIIENYLGKPVILSVNVTGFETINDLGFGHAQASVSIFLRPNEGSANLIDSYFAFITFQPIDNKSFQVDVGFQGNDSDDEQEFLDLGLEGLGHKSKFSIQDDPELTADNVRNYLGVLVINFIKENPKLIEKVIGTSKVWNPRRINYGYTFGKNKGLIKKLVDYLDSGKIGTKLDFLLDIGYIEKETRDGKTQFRKKKGGFLYNPRDLRGQHSSFFASAVHAGILSYRKVGKEFFLVKGPNFEAFKKGELKAL